MLLRGPLAVVLVVVVVLVSPTLQAAPERFPGYDNGVIEYGNGIYDEFGQQLPSSTPIGNFSIMPGQNASGETYLRFARNVVPSAQDDICLGVSFPELDPIEMGSAMPALAVDNLRFRVLGPATSPHVAGLHAVLQPPAWAWANDGQGTTDCTEIEVPGLYWVTIDFVTSPTFNAPHFDAADYRFAVNVHMDTHTLL